MSSNVFICSETDRAQASPEPDKMRDPTSLFIINNYLARLTEVMGGYTSPYEMLGLKSGATITEASSNLLILV